jgi:phage tail sheath protein FI
MNTTLNKNSSYYALYPIWKWQYDKYADKYRWIPGSADVAGVIATVDAARAAWFAPAGFNYGQIKNYSKLAYNPNRAQRDTLYKNRINPVCDIPGQGAVILGQKTGLSRPSIFDRISARRLFLVIERAIAKFALSYIMEKNTDENRSRFSTTVRGYLETIRGGEGIADYLVKCDTTNNTPAVLAANQFIADIYVKPTPDAEFIELNFYGVGPNIEISELVK